MHPVLQLAKDLNEAVMSIAGKSSHMNGARCCFDGNNWRGIFIDRFSLESTSVGKHKLSAVVNVISREDPNLLPGMLLMIEVGSVRVHTTIQKTRKFHKKNRDAGYQTASVTAMLTDTTIARVHHVQRSETEVRAFLAGLSNG